MKTVTRLIALFVILLSFTHPASAQLHNATQIWSRNIAPTAPTNGQVYAWNSSTRRWEPGSGGSGTVTSAVIAGTALQIIASGTCTITTTGTCTLSLSPTVQLGTANTTKGTLSFYGNTSGDVTIQPAAAAGTWSLTLPTTGGTSGYFLQTNGSGVSTWALPAGTPCTTTALSLQFNSAGAFGCVTGYTVSGSGQIITGGSSSVLDMSLGTTSLDASHVVTGTAFTMSAGATIMAVPSASLFGLKTSCGNLPSTAASGGGWGCTTAGIPVFNDNTNTNAIVQFPGNAAALNTPPTATHHVVWAANYGLATSGNTVWPTAELAVALTNQTSLRGNAMAAAAGDATIGQVIAHGATALNFASTATGACATVLTATATGAASTDVIIFNANASIKAVTGFIPAATGGFSIAAYPTTNTANFEACNWTAGTVDPGSITVNWVVIR